MLDPCFKNMKVIWDFVGNTHAIQILIDYDTNIMCFLLLHVFFHLNLVRASIADQPIVIEDDDLFFGWIV
jgi:hypothetical protein